MKFSTKIQTLEDGVKMVGIRGDDSKPLLVTLKQVKATPSANGEIIVSTEDDRLKALEGEVLEKAKENKVAWFGKEISDSKLESAFAPCYSEDDKELSCTRSDAMKVYDSKRTYLEDRDLTDDDVVDVVVQLSGVQFLRKSFETVWVMHQAKLFQPPKPKRAKVDFSECLFEDEGDKEEESDEEEFC